MLHIEHISCVITNCGQHQWVIPFCLSLALYALLEENIIRKSLSLSLNHGSHRPWKVLEFECCLEKWFIFIILIIYWNHLVVCPSVCRRHGFQSITQVCFGISISNFICMLFVAMDRSLYIFSDVTFKLATWQPYWIFGFWTIFLLWLWSPNFTSTSLVCMGRSLLIFSNVTFKMTA